MTDKHDPAENTAAFWTLILMVFIFGVGCGIVGSILL